MTIPSKTLKNFDIWVHKSSTIRIQLAPGKSTVVFKPQRIGFRPWRISYLLNSATMLLIWSELTTQVWRKSYSFKKINTIQAWQKHKHSSLKHSSLKQVLDNLAMEKQPSFANARLFWIGFSAIRKVSSKMD